MSASRAGSALAEYLRARRKLTTPEAVGLPREPTRRVTGLRRSEVAQLAGISVDYYVRLEQGRDRQPSDQVLFCLARALRLNEHERSYLLRLASAAPAKLTPLHVPSPIRGDDDLVTTFLDSWSCTPAFVADRNQDIIESNALARRLLDGGLEPGQNVVLQIFRDVVRDADPDWVGTATRHLAALRYWSDPQDPRLRQLLGTLGTMASDFASMWARYDAYPLTHGHLHVPAAGRGILELRSLTFSVPGAIGTTVTTVFADDGSPGREALQSLQEELAGADRASTAGRGAKTAR